jgi:acyl carrier protein
MEKPVTITNGEPVKDEQAIRAQVREVLLELAPLQGQPVPDDPQQPAPELVNDLGYNSLALLEAVVVLEEELGFMLTGDDEAIADIRTVSDVQDYVVRLAARAGD